MHMPAKDQSVSSLHALLASSGLRPTFARLAIMQALQGSPETCMTAGDVHTALMRRNAPLPLNTIYRCLNAFERRGIVTREWDITGQLSRAKYFLVSRRRSMGACRFHCRCCGRSVEVHDATLFNALQEQTRALDFLPFAAVLRVESLCVRCANFSGITPDLSVK